MVLLRLKNLIVNANYWTKATSFWINTHVPTRDWQDQVNGELDAAAKNTLT